MLTEHATHGIVVSQIELSDRQLCRNTAHYGVVCGTKEYGFSIRYAILQDIDPSLRSWGKVRANSDQFVVSPRTHGRVCGALCPNRCTSRLSSSCDAA